MGSVYLGMSPGGRPVAVKLLRAVHKGDEEFRVRFAREVTAARKVNGFYTAQVVDADAGATPPWLATAYISGLSLQAAVQRQGPFPPPAVKALGAALAEGLVEIHRCDLVHRDLKPANITLSPDGPRIIDFGVAHLVEDNISTLTKTGTIIGSVAYMSPEQASADPVGAPSDVFSLGSVLAYAGSGHGPFDAPLQRQVIFRIVGGDPDLSGLPAELHGLITDCLCKDPGDRPSPRDLLARLRGSTWDWNDGHGGHSAAGTMTAVGIGLGTASYHDPSARRTAVVDDINSDRPVTAIVGARITNGERYTNGCHYVTRRVPVKAIGIDLGTTDSAVAYYDPDRKRADIVPNLIGDRLTPSVVTRVTDGKREVGRRAQKFAQRDPKNTIISVKRLMGRDYADPAVAEARDRLSYRIVPGPGEDPRAHVMIGEKRYSPAEVSAMILDKLKTDSGTRLGETPTHAVITVPAYFTEGQRAATREAGERAGLVVKRIIDEPTAAAIAFGVDLPAGDRRRILVYDLGGRTFDISILNAVNGADGSSQVRSFTGDPWLGGDDFDLLIVDRIIAWVKDTTGQDPTSSAQFWFLAKEHAERAKRELTEFDSTYIYFYFDGLRGTDDVLFEVEMELTRADFDTMVAPLVEKTIDLVRRALDEAKLSRDDISDVLLVGGATLMPAVYRAVEQFFGAAKVRRNLNPMECVAIGAGILAGTLEGVECPNPACKTVNDESRTQCSNCGHSLAGDLTTGFTEVYDVTGQTMGIATVRGSSTDVFLPIIPAGTPYPMSDPIVLSFEATEGRHIRVPVFEGNDPVASKNTEVGLLEFDLPEEIDLGTRVEVGFRYDRNLEVKVTVTVPGTSIMHSTGLFTAPILQA